MLRQHIGLVSQTSVYGRGDIARHTTVADEPAKIVTEFLAPFLREREPLRCATITTGQSASASCDRKCPLGAGGRRRQVQDPHLVIDGKFLSRYVPAVRCEDSVARRAPQSHAIGEIKADNLVLTCDHDRLWRGQFDPVSRLIGVRYVMGVHAECLAKLHSVDQVGKCHETFVGVHERVTGKARVGSVDPAGVVSGMPFVDRGVELEARVGALPRRLSDLIPQVTCTHALHDFAACDRFQAPISVLLDCRHELVGDPNRVVGVLVLDRERIGTIEVHVEAGVAQHAGLALLFDLAPHELFDVGMIDVEDHHFGGAPRLATRLDRAG